MIPRPYQRDAIESAMEHLARGPSTRIVQATGLGKTTQFCWIAERFVARGRVLIVADREELLDQARDELYAVTGIRADLERAKHVASDGMFKSPVVLTSIQTQRSGSNGDRRWHKFDPFEFSLIIIDEADLACADSYREMMAHYRQNPSLKVLGVTATPNRHDGKTLNGMFGSVAHDFRIFDGVKEGWIVRPKQKYLDVELNLDGAGYSLGDFKGKELREILAAGDTIERIASGAIQWAEDRKSIVFCDSVENAGRMAEAFNRSALGSAYIVTGKTPKDERPGIIDRFRASGFQWLVNVGVCTRGFNVPDVRCIVLARPTLSATLHVQMIGRGTRTLPGVLDGIDDADVAGRRAAIAASAKPSLLVLDVVGNCAKHSLATTADALGGTYSDAVVALADKMIRESAVPVDVLDALEQAQDLHNAEIQRRAKERGALRLHAKPSARDIDPFAFYGIEQSRDDFDNGEPMQDWQREKIEGWKLKHVSNLTARDADRIIAEYRRRGRNDLLTIKQEAVLRRYGYDASNMPYERAHAIMDALARNGWKPLKGARA